MGAKCDMGWNIKCSDSNCGQETWAANIGDLIEHHRDEAGWIVCRQCGKPGYIEKSYGQQEGGEPWEPRLRGVITLGGTDETYQPFVFLLDYKDEEKVKDIWFSYYKDLRKSGGKLKTGAGPGGAPVFGKQDLLNMLSQSVAMKYVTKEEIVSSLGKS
jgi:hypothetical protein